MYGNVTNQDGNVRSTDILRDTDVAFTGETTLSNGLTVGAFIGTDGDASDSFNVQDSYIFLANTYGKLIVGATDGANYFLQVEAPSADNNVDGAMSYVSPINFANTSVAGTEFETDVSVNGLDYDNDLTAGMDKVVYFTPIMSGFQAAISYAPDTANLTQSSRSSAGNSPDDTLDSYGSAIEASVRYQNDVSDFFSYTLGAGYSTVEVEKTNASSTVDDYKMWNTAIDMNIGAFGVGAVYTENNRGKAANSDSKTAVFGVDYTVGQIKYGASYLYNTHEASATSEIKAQRVAAGIMYEYGPGLSFRSTLSHTAVSVPAAIGADVDGTSLTFGTVILF